MRNLAYARAACLDAIKRKQNPFASHLYYTSFLRDEVNEERALGMKLAREMLLSLGASVVFYMDLGDSDGMKEMRDFCLDHGIAHTERTLKRSTLIPILGLHC